MNRGSVWLLAAASHGAMCAALARAQVHEFRLGPDGAWVDASRPPADKDEATIAEARRLLAADKPDAARRLLDDWIEAHRRTDHPLVPEAYLLRGDAWTASGNEYEALYDYEALARGYPGAPEFVTALERELDIAVRYVHGYKRKQLGIRWIDATTEGVELLIRIQERLPGSRLAERAAIELADAYQARGELELATQMYSIFLKNYPRSEYRRRAMVRLVDAQVRHYHGPRYDARGLREARDLVEDFREAYPADADREGLNTDLLNRIDEELAAQMLERARFYERRGDGVSSRFTLRRLVHKHPGTAAANEALGTLRERGWAFTEPGAASTPAAPQGER